MKVKTSDGKILELALQQYEVGLYYCFYENGRLYNQGGLNTTKEKFLKDLKSGKLGVTVVNE